MMRPMENRSAVVAALLAASLTSLAASARLYLWPDAPGPVLLSPPPPLAIPPTAPAATRSVEIRPGDNFAGALMSAGLRARMAAELATLFAKNGAELRKRSEEHTSELQSRLHLVCRLLLEKKKQNITQ